MASSIGMLSLLKLLATIQMISAAFLLRTPSAKAQAWKDMLALKAAMVREVAAMLKALAKYLGEHKETLYAISAHTGATRADSWVDIEGGSGTLGAFVMTALKKDAGVNYWGNTGQVTGAVGLLDRVAPLCFAAPVFFHSVRWYFQLKS